MFCELKRTENDAVGSYMKNDFGIRLKVLRKTRNYFIAVIGVPTEIRIGQVSTRQKHDAKLLRT
jgi:hypothetical protein